MTIKKLQRFAELAAFSNVFQAPANQGCWRDSYFKNNNPITLELACGKGEYTLALSGRFPEQNFIGIDLKGARLWRGAKTALEQNLKNVAFIRTPIERIPEYFGPGEVDQIWITFPDPYPRPGKAKKRLTSPRFLNLYRQILKPGGLIHLKTDDQNLFNYTLETVTQLKLELKEKVENLYAKEVSNELLTVKTTFELKHLQAGRGIKYLCFQI
jgi:tRNA (guanine-N7-)-methyltransferase